MNGKIRAYLFRILNIFQSIFVLSLVSTAQVKDVRISDARIKKMDIWLEDLVKSNKIPGAVYVITQGNKVLRTHSVGYADIATKQYLTDSSIFRITSMTKTITVVALMTLYEDGKFLLTDPVSKFIPAFRNMRIVGAAKSDSTLTNEITILDLLLNTSGLPSFSSDAFNDLLTNAKTDEEMALGLAKIPLEFKPGTSYLYGASYEVLGYLIEVISGKRLDQFYDERIFRPLQMNDTYFFVPQKKAARFAGAYKFDINGNATQIRKSGEDDGTNRNRYDAAGGLKTTAKDFGRFCRMLLNDGNLDGKRILSPAIVKLMLQDHVGSLYPDFESGCGWGFGAEIVNNLKRNELSSAGTYRWGGFYGTQFFVDPLNDLAAIIMVQIFPNADLGIQSKFEIFVRQAILKYRNGAPF